VEDNFAFIPPGSLPQPTQARSEAPVMVNKPYEVIETATVTGKLGAKEARLNEGAVDPAGRFLAGTMGRAIGTHDGRMFSLRQTSGGFEAPLVLDGITCTKGMAWFDDGRKMYFTDSWVKEITVFDYDLAKGAMSNRRVFSDMKTPEVGYPDGMCLDAEGGVWSARWCAGKVIRLNPETATIDVEIDLPNAWNVTCCIFGGDNLDDLYITTAKCDTDNQNPADRTEKGKLYRISGLGYRGVERGRFKGTF
jgi:sugar lactone lactonase YvrE